jgi:cytochrome P450
MKQNLAGVQAQPTIAEPPAIPLLGHVGIFRGPRHENLLQVQREYGDFVRLRLSGKPMYLVSDPYLIKYVIQDTHSNQIKAGGLQKARSFLRNGLLLSNGDVWRTNRRLCQPAFNASALAEYANVMARCAADWAERWQAAARRREIVDVHKEMLELSLTVVTKTLFTTSLSQSDFEVFGRCLPFLMRVVARRMYSILDLKWLPTADNLRFRRFAGELDRIVYRIIDERRRGADPGSDLLGTLLASTDEQSNARLDDEQLRDEVMTLLTAGHETTALLMSWTWYLLARHPEVFARLLEEARAAKQANKSPLEIASLPYVRAVLQETLRLYPPAWVVRRQLLQQDRVGASELPAGTDFLFSSYVVHRHPRYWPDPERFDPERFLDGSGNHRPKFTYFPFGGGPRICIGQHFGLMEAAIVVSTLASRFTLETEVEVQPESSFTLRPDRPIYMRIGQRNYS